MKHVFKGVIAAVAAVVLGFTLSACNEDQTLSVPQSFCGFLQGNGGRDNDQHANSADVTQVLYQGQQANYKTDQQTGYVLPCVQRNFVIAPEGQSADSNAPLHGITAKGTPVNIWVSAYWQPNQQPDPLRSFIGFCQGKYGCAATDPRSFTGTDQNQNASTPGWNKMLSENMYPVLQRIVEAPVRLVDDDVWKFNDPKQRENIQNEMSDRFGAEFQQVTGSVVDLICGAGSVGQGKDFDCKSLSIKVDRVTAASQQAQDAAANAAGDAAKRAIDEQNKAADINLTNEKYGPLAPAYRACRDLNADKGNGTCKFVVGPAQVQIPGQ